MLFEKANTAYHPIFTETGLNNASLTNFQYPAVEIFNSIVPANGYCHTIALLPSGVYPVAAIPKLSHAGTRSFKSPPMHCCIVR